MKFASLGETAALAKSIAKSGAKSMAISEHFKYYGGVPFGHISQEYLFSSSVMPLNSIIEFFGDEGSCKTSLVLSLLNQLFLEPGGEGRLINTENKLNLPLIQSLISPEADAEMRFKIDNCDSQEAAQSVITAYVKELRAKTFGKRCDKMPHLLGLALDSFRVASETTVDSVESDGHSKKNYAVEANLWRSYMGSYTSMASMLPMVWMIVNHLVEKDSANGFGKVKDTGGGRALKFYETYRICVSKVKTNKSKSEVYTDIMLRTYKNSNGPVGNKIMPRIIYKSSNNTEDGEDGQLHRTVVDWNVADALLLTGADIPRDALRRDGVCCVKESSKAGLYNDDVLGLSGVPFSEIHQAIYSDPERLSMLRKHLDISTFKTIEQLWEDGWFYGAKSLISGDDD
jgi:RecA/RadA recombinase